MNKINRPTKNELEKHLGKNVCVELRGGRLLNGVLTKTGNPNDKNNSSLYIPKNSYYLKHKNHFAGYILFKVSHIKNISYKGEQK